MPIDVVNFLTSTGICFLFFSVYLVIKKWIARRSRLIRAQTKSDIQTMPVTVDRLSVGDIVHEDGFAGELVGIRRHIDEFDHTHLRFKTLTRYRSTATEAWITKGDTIVRVQV